MATTNSFSAYLKTTEGLMEAQRFCDALTEGRMFVEVIHVSQSGMQRVITLREVRYNAESEHNKAYMWNFNSFAEKAGFKMHRKFWGSVVNGCGMDMRFHIVDTIANSIKYYTDGKIDCTAYTNNFNVL